MMAATKPTTMDAYVRVSRVGGREGESFISPDEQRRIIRQWADLRGVSIAAWHEDLDQSGGRLDRPGLDACMERIRSGETGGVAVAKLDRLSRAGVADALKLVDDIHAHGGQLAAVDLGIDPTTDVGELLLTLMLALARMERRRLTAGWEAAKTRAVERGAKLAVLLSDSPARRVAPSRRTPSKRASSRKPSPSALATGSMRPRTTSQTRCPSVAGLQPPLAGCFPTAHISERSATAIK